MSELTKGKLVAVGTQIKVRFRAAKGETDQPTGGELSQALASRPAGELDGLEVEFEYRSGKPTKIRPVGQPYQAAAPAPARSPQGQARGPGGQGQRYGAPGRPGGSRDAPAGPPGSGARSASGGPRFHNPYGFVPAPRRDLRHPALGDRTPAGHDRYLAELLTGRIELEIEVVTPVLILDAAGTIEMSVQAAPAESGRGKGRPKGKAAAAHKSLPLRLVDGKPFLPPSSLKGVLRSAFEAVTNSRFGVFSNHERQAYRDEQTRRKETWEFGPADLLDDSLKVACSLGEFSPADRLFGWVARKGEGAYRGQVRLGATACLTPEAYDLFPAPGLPLAILGQPKIQQGRFYVAASRQGEAQRNGLSKRQAGYDSLEKGLRGRKVYPHQRVPDGHWASPMTDRTRQPSGAWYQEYRRPMAGGAEQRDDQNRSVQGWIRPGARFTSALDVSNLSPVEAGALLWLLSLPEAHFLRMAGGKPLGFGSIRVRTTGVWLQTGAQIREAYLSLAGLGGGPVEDQEALARLVEAFKAAVSEAYPGGRRFEEVPYIAAFLRAAAGQADGLPTHYPRVQGAEEQGRVPPNVEGKQFEWFAANETREKLVLPDLVKDQGLPILKRRGR